MKGKLHIKKRKGGALIMVILVMLIMIILGTTILSISVTENKQAIREKNRIEAYYLARSGVEATAAWITDPDRKAEEIDKIINNKSHYNDFGNGKFNVEIIEDSESEDLIIISANAIVNNVSSQSRLVINKKSISEESLKFQYTIYAGSNLTVKGNTKITGEVAYGEQKNLTNNVSINVGDKPTEIDYPILPVPKADKDINLGEEIVFDENVKSIKIKGKNDEEDISIKKNLEINTGKGEGEVNLIVDGNFDFGKNHHDELTIKGKRKLNIYVNGDVNIDGNINPGSSRQNLLFILSGTGNFNLSNNNNHSEFNAFIYAPEATFITGGNSNMKGAIIAKNVEMTGTPFAKGYNFDSENGNIAIPFSEVYSRGEWLD